MRLLGENRRHGLNLGTRHGEHVRGPGIFQGGGGPTRAGSVLRREEELERLTREIQRSSAELQKALAHAENLRGGRADAMGELEGAHLKLKESEEAQRAEETKRAEHQIRKEASARARSRLEAALEGVESDLKEALAEPEIARQA